MNQLVEQYQQLLRILREIHTSRLCAMEKNEKAFQVSYISWQKAEQIYQSKCFNTSERIYFNRYIRSGFIAELEYVLLMHHALLFEPRPFSSDAEQFWIREVERIELFIRQYSDFYHYIKSGHYHKDKYWFVKSSKHYFPGNQINFQATGDVLLGQLTALESYFIYCSNKLKNLPPSGTYVSVW